MNQRRVVIIASGGLGLVAGILALMIDAPILGLVAGLCAVAGTAVLFLWPEPPVPSAPVVTTESRAVVQVTERADQGLLDPVTGLFNGQYFKAAVESRVLAARRHLRPVAIVLFDVIDTETSITGHRADPVPVASAIRLTLREADTACRLDDGRYGFVLEDTPEDGAIWTVERLRRRLSEGQPEQTRWAGIACYPAHAFSAEEVMDKAEHAFTAAREWAQDRIEVALTE